MPAYAIGEIDCEEGDDPEQEPVLYRHVQEEIRYRMKTWLYDSQKG